MASIQVRHPSARKIVIELAQKRGLEVTESNGRVHSASGETARKVREVSRQVFEAGIVDHESGKMFSEEAAKKKLNL